MEGLFVRKCYFTMHVRSEQKEKFWLKMHQIVRWSVTSVCSWSVKGSRFCVESKFASSYTFPAGFYCWTSCD